jgi:putative transposase
MLDRMVEKARQQEVFSREDTPLCRRVLGTFLYHAGLSYRKIEPFVERSYEAIRQWFHRLKQLFEPDCRDRQVVAVDETKIEIDGEEVYVWAAVDCDTLEVLSVDVSSGRSGLDALLFLKEVMKRCRGGPRVRAARGPGFGWALGLLECDYVRETWGNRSLIEAWFGLFKYQTRRFWYRFPYNSFIHSTQSWLTAFATLHNATTS